MCAHCFMTIWERLDYMDMSMVCLFVLVEDGKVISCDDQIAKKFSEYFVSIPILNMPSNGYKCPES